MSTSKSKSKSKSKRQGERPVLVTTEWRGVFFGYLAQEADYDRAARTIKLGRAKNCVYWTAETKGFVGLAVTGPGNGCRIGPAADLELHEVTAVVSVTPAAVERWERTLW